MKKSNKKKIIKEQPKKENHLQKLYDEGKLMSVEFYENCTNMIKPLLMKYLIKKEYYKQGALQTNFDHEDLIDCYTFVMDKVYNRYDPTRSNVASYIHLWVKGYCSTILSKQHKTHKYKAGTIASLDDILAGMTPKNFIVEDCYSDIEEDIDINRLVI